MAQTILIKRSTSTAVPTSLTNGELAYSSVGNGKLFIGRPGGEAGDVDAIGGKYFTDIISGATDAATVSTLVLRDASGDFAANMITSDLTGAVTGTVSDISNHSTATLSEDTNLYYTNARARASISATGPSLGYDSATGVLTYYQQNTDTVAEGSSNLYHTTERAQDAAAAMITGATHSNILVAYDEDTNTLAFTASSQYADSDARAAISVTDAGGDGSLSYASGTGVITYTGPSSTEVRAHFSGGTGVEITDGSIAIGQAVSTTSNVTFNDVSVNGTLTSNDITSSAISIDGNATITGNLTVEGTTTTVNSTTVEIGDNILVLNKQLAADTAPSTNAGFTVYRGTGLGAKDSVSLLWNEVNGYWTVQEGDDASTTSRLMTADNWAGSFTGTIDGGTF